MRPSPTATELSVPRGAAGETASQSGGEAADYLSALPDDLLHRIMSSLKAWEVVRTSVLARRWRRLWESATCLDVRTRFHVCERAPQNLCGFVYSLFLLRDPFAPVDTFRVRLGADEPGEHDNDKVNAWIKIAIKHKARVIHAGGHRRFPVPFVRVPSGSYHLKILKLSYARLDLGQLSSSCTSLEELDLKDCLLKGDEVVSVSLKTLTMLNCKMDLELSIAAPSLILLRLITPYARVPSFKNLGSLVIGTVIIDDYFLSDDISEDDDYDETTDDDDDVCACRDITDQDDSDINSDANTYDYSKIAEEANYGFNADSYEDNEINDSESLSGQNILRSLSNVTSLGLLTQAGEVILVRELKRCPTFSNLKTLSLGEWCMAADFDAIILLLQHSPNIERLFLELKLNFDTRSRKALKTGIKLQGRSFTCKDLQMVNIRCSNDDLRVHKLAQLFIANGIPHEKIFVRWTGNAYLRAQELTEQAMNLLTAFGPDLTPIRHIKFLDRSSLVVRSFLP